MDNTPRKERERLAKRQEILIAAREVFAKKGLHAATLDEIAEKAEFAKGTLYGYFQSKEELFATMLEEEIVKFKNCLELVSQEKLPATAKVEKVIETMLSVFDQNVDFLRLFSKERPGMRTIPTEEKMIVHIKDLTSLVAGIIRQGTKEGVFASKDPERTAVALFNLTHGSAMSSFLNKKKINDTKEIKFIVDLLFNGIKA